MPNYQNGKIYKLVSNISNDIYIGSTVNKLQHRLNIHKCKTSTCTSKRLFTNDAVIKIILLELYPCNNKMELTAREYHYITTLVCINKHIPFITDIPFEDRQAWNKEYYKANIEHKKEYDKEYYEANVEHKKEYGREYGKDYYEANKDKIKECNKEYREANKDKINERRREQRAKAKLQPIII